MRQPTEAEYGEFARAAWPRLYRSAVMILGDRQLAEDLVQTALVKTYVAWPRLRQPDKALTYARRAMVNLSRDWFRKHAWTHESTVDVAARDGGSDDDHVAELVERVALAEALRSLPPGQRSVVVLRFLDDLSVRETADLLNVSTGTVKSQTSAALAALRLHVQLVPGGNDHD